MQLITASFYPEKVSGCFQKKQNTCKHASQHTQTHTDTGLAAADVSCHLALLCLAHFMTNAQLQTVMPSLPSCPPGHTCSLTSFFFFFFFFLSVSLILPVQIKTASQKNM